MRPTSWLSPEGEVRISYEIKDEAAEEASQLIPLSLEAGGEKEICSVVFLIKLSATISNEAH
jgi:hypothetical protein